jgi:hypothetical protein
MPITYTLLIDWNDDGDFADANEDLGADVLALSWRLGMTMPFQHVAPPGTAQITVRSRDRRYSPEAAIQPLRIGKRLRIQSNDGSTVRTHFTGFIESVEPQPGTLGERTAIIHAATADAQLTQWSVRLPAFVNARSDIVVTALLNSLPLHRAGLSTLWVLEVAGYGELDNTARLAADESIPRLIETGISTFAYVGDLWNIPADAALRQTVESERGRCFANRQGEVVFYNRHHTLITTAPSAVLDNDAEALDYGYGANFANHVLVMIIPRKVGLPNSPLWTLENVQRLPPGVRRITVSYRDPDGNAMGALSVSALTFAANSQPDGNGFSISITGLIVEAGASAALLEFRNESGTTVYLLPGAQVLGTPLYIGAPIEIEQTDTVSVTFHGQRTRVFTAPLLDSADEADQMARYELRLRREPQGVVTALATSTRAHPQQVLARTLFDRIRVMDGQTGHDAEYLIVGEAHDIDLGGTRHRVRWTLERADPTLFWQIDSSRLDQTTTAAY